MKYWFECSEYRLLISFFCFALLVSLCTVHSYKTGHQWQYCNIAEAVTAPRYALLELHNKSGVRSEHLNCPRMGHELSPLTRHPGPVTSTYIDFRGPRSHRRSAMHCHAVLLQSSQNKRWSRDNGAQSLSSVACIIPSFHWCCRRWLRCYDCCYITMDQFIFFCVDTESWSLTEKEDDNTRQLSE